MTGDLFTRSSRVPVFEKKLVRASRAAFCFLVAASVTVCNLTHLPVPEPGGARCLWEEGWGLGPWG